MALREAMEETAAAEVAKAAVGVMVPLEAGALVKEVGLVASAAAAVS